MTDFITSLPNTDVATNELRRLADYSDEEIAIGAQDGANFNSFDAFRRA